MPTIISPVPPVLHQPVALAPRPQGLEGRRISILDNSKANAGRLLEAVRDVLVTEHGAVRGLSERKSSAGIPASPGTLERLRADSDLVLTASADCGSCTSGCVQDTVALERLGVACVLLGTDAFAPLAAKLADWLGLSDLQRAVTPHPLGGIADEEIDAKALVLAGVVADGIGEIAATQAGSPVGV